MNNFVVHHIRPTLRLTLANAGRQALLWGLLLGLGGCVSARRVLDAIFRQRLQRGARLGSRAPGAFQSDGPQ